jgi:hypothetical protein
MIAPTLSIFQKLLDEILKNGSQNQARLAAGGVVYLQERCSNDTLRASPQNVLSCTALVPVKKWRSGASHTAVRDRDIGSCQQKLISTCVQPLGVIVHLNLERYFLICQNSLNC